jgi:hypothetical protein
LLKKGKQEVEKAFLENIFPSFDMYNSHDCFFFLPGVQSNSCTEQGNPERKAGNIQRGFDITAEYYIGSCSSNSRQPGN